MSKSRKTFSVSEFRNQVNAYLLNTRDDMQDQRRGNMVALESVLHATDNYKGFGYLTSDHMEDSNAGTTVGINVSARHPSESMDYAERFKNTDNSRVYYY